MKLLLTSLLICSLAVSYAQDFTKADELRGSITEERAWWDLQHYDLRVEVFPKKKEIQGTNTITYRVLEEKNTMQIDLQEPMQIDKILQDGKNVKFKSKGSAHFLKLKQDQEIGEENTVTIYFSGAPKEAVRAPWDGGFSWDKDTNGKDFIATSNQGIGSSIWWPNKDHPADEPDRGVDMQITAPTNLTAVGNGRLIETTDNGSTKTWHWKVINPINNYGVNINIGDYAHISKKYEGLLGELDTDFYVLKYNVERAEDQFSQVPMMLQAFEYYFGPYPFYEDSYKLVEVPYLGMEHQSSVTYGNKFQNGYLGRDLSESGWGLRFDFIIIHESGHEWFANNITNKDVADMWIHEGFTAYSENLYLNYHYSEEAASEYVIGTRRMIQNDRPLIGVYNRNHEGSGDMYYKGANTLHTLRQWVNDDTKWRQILRGLNTEFRHQTVTSKQIEDFMAQQSGLDLTAFWEQYLRTVKIPKLQYKKDHNSLQFKYDNVVDGFTMPVIMMMNGKEEWITPTSEWQTQDFTGEINELYLKPDFYIDSEEITE